MAKGRCKCVPDATPVVLNVAVNQGGPKTRLFPDESVRHSKFFKSMMIVIMITVTLYKLSTQYSVLSHGTGSPSASKNETTLFCRWLVRRWLSSVFCLVSFLIIRDLFSQPIYLSQHFNMFRYDGRQKAVKLMTFQQLVSTSSLNLSL